MPSKESAGSNFDLPEKMLEVFPSDPFEQLDVARKITSIALSTSVSAPRIRGSVLLQQLTDRDAIIAELQSQLEFLDAKPSLAQQDKENLLRENVQLSSTAKKLNRDVAKLEALRKTLMKSLQEDDDKSVLLIELAYISLAIQSLEIPYTENPETEGLLLASQSSTPPLTPPASPPSLSASVSPSRTPKPVSPRRHSISFSTTRGIFEDKSSSFSSVASSQHSSFSGLDEGSQSGRTRVDEIEFFSPVRNRLSYE